MHRRILYASAAPATEAPIPRRPAGGISILALGRDAAAGSSDSSRPAPVAGCIADTGILRAGRPNGSNLPQTSCNTNGVGTAHINTEQRNDVVGAGIRFFTPQAHAPPHKREQQTDQRWYY